MLGIGFLLRGYSSPVFGIDINALYIPHGIMAGAGLVALIQIIFLMRGKRMTRTTNAQPRKGTCRQARR